MSWLAEKGPLISFHILFFKYPFISFQSWKACLVATPKPLQSFPCPCGSLWPLSFEDLRSAARYRMRPTSLCQHPAPSRAVHAFGAPKLGVPRWWRKCQGSDGGVWGLGGRLWQTLMAKADRKKERSKP